MHDYTPRDEQYRDERAAHQEKGMIVAGGRASGDGAAAETAAQTAAQTAAVVGQLLERMGAGDLDGIAALFASDFEWHLSWPDSELVGSIPWIRPRRTPADVRAHFAALAEHNSPDGAGTTVERVLVDGRDAVVLGTIRNVLRRIGTPYRADFALHLTIEDGRVRRYHVYEDSLAVSNAWNATPHDGER